MAVTLTATLGLLTAATGLADLPKGPATLAQVVRGRQLVLVSNCADCHNGNPRLDPSDPDWLANRPGLFFQFDRSYRPSRYRTYPRNLTPDNATGLGRISERQIFNALRYGLVPGFTPDVVITSTVPGRGGFPADPKYLAPPMPWPAWRHMPDEDLWAIVAYLKHGIKPVRHRVPFSEGPADFWAGESTAEVIGDYPLPAYPAGNEEFRPEGTVTLEQVHRGRVLVLQRDCAACHSGGKHDPRDPAWLAGFLPSRRGPEFPIGAFKSYGKNLTPDSATGLGRFSDRQLFNALRYGLEPNETPDVVITSSTPGEGNFPALPRYLAPPMPWPSIRHLPDEDLWAIIAYLKHGVRPVRNPVPDSPGPPDFWASVYTREKIGHFPLPAYPTGNESFRP